jgi:hypothetical protein
MGETLLAVKNSGEKHVYNQKAELNIWAKIAQRVSVSKKDRQ